MRRASTSPSIQLFPFLAVLVCAMGALILLLLVTTRKMRQAAVARAAAEAEAEAEASRPPPIRPALPPESPAPVLAPSGPTPDELAEHRAARDARLQANATARKRQASRQAEWQRSLAEAEIARDQRRQRVQETEAELNELQQKLEETETHLQRLADKKSLLKSVFEKDSKERADAEREHARLTEAITAAQKALADIRRAHADAASKFAFIPYDGASGTTRRPVYIECTSTGIRFQPEYELLDESDLKGFTETFNPLLVASQRLMQYWREQSIATDDPRQPARPYILILVRPKGTISYYVARKMLSQLGDDFGYELIEDDFELQLPPADPDAKLTIQRAVADTLRNRGEMLAVGSRVGAPRLGEVLMGRNEELIEFGTLDDQVAATVAREESPFAKNSGTLGKGFEVTRSPVERTAVKSSSLKAALAERDRQRANGVPGSLAEMVGRDGERGGPVPDGIASSGNPGGTRANQRPNSGIPKNVTGTGLPDPFSRDHLATGRSGVGSANEGDSRGERTAGDTADPQSLGKVADANGTSENDGTLGTGSGSRTAPRLNQGVPRGARAGKIIDVPSNASSSAEEQNVFTRIPQSVPINTPADSSPSDGRTRTARHGAGMSSRSTDPAVQQQRSYGDNPEARKQLAAASSSKTTMQKRDAARRRWGGTNTGQIGFERKVNVTVMADKIVVGENDIEVVIEPGTKPDELVESVLSSLDEHSQAWGKPPTRFYWVPYVNFDVYSGGHTQYQQLHGPLREWGIFSEVKFKEGNKPQTAKEPNLIQPVSKTTAAAAVPDKTAPKRIGPVEAPSKKSATSAKSRFSWFGTSWFKKIPN